MKKTERRHFSAEFKEDAVKLVLGGRSASGVARDLDIDVSSLNRWRRQYLGEMDEGHEGAGQSPSEMAAENKRLRKELAHEREINTILKKTIKYVS
ncbi:MAG: transposase [Desulfohalobium sp.]